MTPAARPHGASKVAAAIVDNIGSVVLGKRDQIVLVTAGLLAGGHVLLEDVPGVGKTLLAKSLAASVGGARGGCRAPPTSCPSTSPA